MNRLKLNGCSFCLGTWCVVAQHRPGFGLLLTHPLTHSLEERGVCPPLVTGLVLSALEAQFKVQQPGGGNLQHMAGAASLCNIWQTGEGTAGDRKAEQQIRQRKRIGMALGESAGVICGMCAKKVGPHNHPCPQSVCNPPPPPAHTRVYSVNLVLQMGRRDTERNVQLAQSHSRCIYTRR